MSENDPFRIHSIRVQQTPQFGPNGVQQLFLLTYMVGDHGPFTHPFKAGEYSPDSARAEMARQQADLMALVG